MDAHSLAHEIDRTAETLDTITGKLQARRDELGGNAWIENRMKELNAATDQLSTVYGRFTELLEVTSG